MESRSLGVDYRSSREEGAPLAWKANSSDRPEPSATPRSSLVTSLGAQSLRSRGTGYPRAGRTGHRRRDGWYRGIPPRSTPQREQLPIGETVPEDPFRPQLGEPHQYAYVVEAIEAS